MRIGALAAAAECNPKTIRFYEDRGLIAAPLRAANGYRDYPPEAVERLRFVRDAQSAGLSLAEIAEVIAIRETGRPPCVHVGQLIADHLAGCGRASPSCRRLRELPLSATHKAAPGRFFPTEPEALTEIGAPPMATLDPTARPSHRPGYVQIDVPTPECTLSTVAPIGAHLVIQASIAQARRLHDKLGRILGETDDEVTRVRFISRGRLPPRTRPMIVVARRSA